ncbi:MAG: hypothetical protein O6857_05580 [Nitrospinae bacterium]|nr:hypothetical protein [Nitrospinota bacterium]
MKNKNITTFAIIVAFTLLLAGCKDPTYSSQSSSPLPGRWQFDPVVVEKIHKNLARGEVAVGLSSLEQRMLEKYGIQIGKSFITPVYGELWSVTRTSTGLRFEESVGPLAPVNLQSFPMIQTHYRILPVSARGPERENWAPDLAWIFDKALQEKIQNRIYLKGVPSEIGLSRFQQKLLQRYGVQVGQSFRTTVAGRILTVKRVSLGLQIQSLAEDKTTTYFSS